MTHERVAELRAEYGRALAALDYHGTTMLLAGLAHVIPELLDALEALLPAQERLPLAEMEEADA